jgi:hypothetical protein
MACACHLFSFPSLWCRDGFLVCDASAAEFAQQCRSQFGITLRDLDHILNDRDILQVHLLLLPLTPCHPCRVRELHLTVLELFAAAFFALDPAQFDCLLLCKRRC